ncbi:sigmaY antisigma factor component [Gorillibacterium sp. sgz500922]|uniref:sigmaY antisigma factor component n=1 Tax=Gorillibacterium sp. sgz500922 TaxID=3446694 RepID=UPI003F672459
MSAVLELLTRRLPDGAAYNESLPVWAWLLIAALLLTQGTWLFRDARKRGAWHWLWGLWGCIQFPTPLIVYWLTVRGGAKRLIKRKP